MHFSSKFKLVLSISLAAILVSCAAFLWSGRTTTVAERSTEDTVKLPVIRVHRADIVQNMELPGEFRPYQEVDVDAKVKGYVKTLLVDVGDKVKQGQLLAVLEIPEVNDNLALAKASVERARQQSLQSRAIYMDVDENYKRLAAVMKERPDLIAQEDIDQAKAKADSAEDAWVAAKSAVVEAEAGEKELTDTLAYTKITAPFNGVIVKRFVDTGALMGDASGRGDGRSLFHLAQVDRLRLVIKIPESVVPKIHVGDLIDIGIPALNRHVSLPISRMSHQVSADTRTMHVEVDYPNPDSAIAPGLYADVNVAVDSRHRVLVLPLSAVFSRKDINGTVFVLRSDGSVEPRFVRLGLVNATDAEVLDGADDGELVAVGVKPNTGKGRLYSAKIVTTKY